MRTLDANDRSRSDRTWIGRKKINFTISFSTRDHRAILEIDGRDEGGGQKWVDFPPLWRRRHLQKIGFEVGVSILDNVESGNTHFEKGAGCNLAPIFWGN